MATLRYRRVVVKLSGQAFAGHDAHGLDPAAFQHVARELLAARELGIEIVVVVGGGNFFRGNRADDWGVEHVEADNVGMLGTVMNGILLRGVLNRHGCLDVRLMTALPMPAMAEPFIRLRALRHLEKNRLVVLVSGVGQPYVTTDYPAVQRALELNAGAILLAKNGIDGIYESDPCVDPTARKYITLGFQDVLRNDLRVMDQSAILMARDYGMPLHIFDFEEKGAISAICRGENRGTYVSPETTTVLSPAQA